MLRRQSQQYRRFQQTKLQQQDTTLLLLLLLLLHIYAVSQRSRQHIFALLVKHAPISIKKLVGMS